MSESSEDAQNFVVKADAGYFLLTAWGLDDGEPFSSSTPVVAWNVQLTKQACGESLPMTYAVPVVPGWQGNDDRETTPWAILMPTGKVEDSHGDTHESEEAWLASEIEADRRRKKAAGVRFEQSAG